MKTINKWKIGTALMLALVFTLQLCMVGNSLASGKVWHCDTDNIDIDSDFCPKCGATRPVLTTSATSQSDTWICPTCGKKLPIDYNYCPDDRTEKTISQYGPWPIRNLNGTSMSFVPSGKTKRQAYYGPSREYAQGGAFYTSNIKEANFISQEGDYILVDMKYSQSGKRCVYFQSSCFVDRPDEEEHLEGYPAVTTSKVQLYQGPGKDYDPLRKLTPRPKPPKEEKKSDKKDKSGNDKETKEKSKSEKKESGKKTEPTTFMVSSNIFLNEGTNITVFFETNEWVFAEVNTSDMLFRAWLPVNRIEANKK